MTYCVAVALKAGLVFVSDSRTNAGVDNVSTYSKMYGFGIPGERQFVVMSSGNLATTQAVVLQIKRDIKQGADETLLNVENINDAAEYIGNISRTQQEKMTTSNGNANFEANFIIGGQIIGHKPACYMIYPQGNYITTSQDTAYLQIGEDKYGKPILDRIITPKSSLETATLCALVSMDSTMRSNLTVGPPIEVTIYEANSLQPGRYHRFDDDSEYLREVKRTWDNLLKEAFKKLPPVAWSSNWDYKEEDDDDSSEQQF
ncbi:MAG: peptidase [Proteobacteria bacterium]|nr:peptidase [Pseudomonadota bacterium]NOG59278.1 peptidase [Pseudomonadota bacterium]